MGKIVRDKYPDLTETDQEAIRQRAVAALNAHATGQACDELRTTEIETRSNTALIDGVRKFAMDVRDLEIDLIDSINPFGEAYAILAKAMDEKRLTQIAEIINGKKVNMSIEEARELANRALQVQE